MDTAPAGASAAGWGRASHTEGGLPPASTGDCGQLCGGTWKWRREQVPRLLGTRKKRLPSTRGDGCGLTGGGRRRPLPVRPSSQRLGAWTALSTGGPRYDWELGVRMSPTRTEPHDVLPQTTLEEMPQGSFESQGRDLQTAGQGQTQDGCRVGDSASALRKRGQARAPRRRGPGMNDGAGAGRGWGFEVPHGPLFLQSAQMGSPDLKVKQRNVYKENHDVLRTSAVVAYPAAPVLSVRLLGTSHPRPPETRTGRTGPPARPAGRAPAASVHV